MKSVSREELEIFLSRIAPDNYSRGVDIGRTHGIICYYDSGRHVATERWVMEDGVRRFTYEVSP